MPEIDMEEKIGKSYATKRLPAEPNRETALLPRSKDPLVALRSIYKFRG
jgi:hypothetical protein